MTQPPKPTFEDALNEFIGRSMTVMGAEPTYGQVATFSREYGKREALLSPVVQDLYRVLLNHHGMPTYSEALANFREEFEKLSGGGT